MRIGFFLLSFLLVQASQAARPEIVVSSAPSVYLTADLPVILADVANVGNAPSRAIRSALNLVVLPPLADREERTFTNAEFVRLVKEKVDNESELSAFHWTYFVPEKIKLIGRNNHLSEARVTSLLKSELANRCESCRFRLIDLKVPTLKESNALVDFEIDFSSLRIAGGFLLPVRMNFGKSRSTYYIAGQVATVATGYVAKRNFAPGEKINPEDFREQDVEVNVASEALATVEDLANKTAGRPLFVGRPAYRSDLKNETLVSRGQVVRVVTGDETFEVNTQMQAEDAGAFGDLVKLKNPETQKMISGKVIDRGIVRIQ